MIPDTFLDFSHRLRVVLKHFSGFFPVAEFLHALSLQMALLGFLEDLVGSAVPLAKELGSLFPTFVEHHGWRSPQRNRGERGKPLIPGSVGRMTRPRASPAKSPAPSLALRASARGYFPFHRVLRDRHELRSTWHARTALQGLWVSSSAPRLPPHHFPRSPPEKPNNAAAAPPPFTLQNNDIPRAPLPPARPLPRTKLRKPKSKGDEGRHRPFLRAKRKAEKLAGGKKGGSGSGETENLWPKSSATRQVPWTWSCRLVARRKKALGRPDLKRQTLGSAEAAVGGLFPGPQKRKRGITRVGFGVFFKCASPVHSGEGGELLRHYEEGQRRGASFLGCGGGRRGGRSGPGRKAPLLTLRGVRSQQDEQEGGSGSRRRLHDAAAAEPRAAPSDWPRGAGRSGSGGGSAAPVGGSAASAEPRGGVACAVEPIKAESSQALELQRHT